MADMITRCPSCETSFRITEAQLKTAKGAVRCGACLHIFKAMDHLVGAKPASPAPQKPKPAAPQPTAKPAAPVAKAPTTKTPTASAAKATPDFPKFEYKKPTAPVAAKPAAPAPKTASARPAAKPTPNALTPKPATPQFKIKVQPDSKAVDDDIFGEGLLDADDRRDRANGVERKSVVQKTKVDKNQGLENMLRFDQSAIDNDDTTEYAVRQDDEDLLISDDLPMDDDEDQPSKKVGAYGEDLGESFIDLDKWKPQDKSLFDIRYKAPKDEDSDQQKKSQTDESWAIDLLNSDDDDDDDPYQFKKSSPNPIELDVDDEDFALDDGTKKPYSRATTGSFDALDDSDIEDALGEPLSAHREPKLSEDYSDHDHRDDSNYRDDHEEDYDYYDEPDDRHAMLRGIQPEPVEFNTGHYAFDWKPKLFWGGLITSLCLLLVAQIAWLQFDTLSRAEPYRGLYETFCPMLGCDVPPMHATNLIRTTNFLVRQHPDTQNALMVDTIILNTAPFAQPFPDLVLAFSNLQGKTVATRRFTPAEYLSGELAGQTSMPSNRPVHLALEIVNPGPDAVNYAAYIP